MKKEKYAYLRDCKVNIDCFEVSKELVYLHSLISGCPLILFQQGGLDEIILRSFGEGKVTVSPSKGELEVYGEDFAKKDKIPDNQWERVSASRPEPQRRIFLEFAYNTPDSVVFVACQRDEKKLPYQQVIFYSHPQERGKDKNDN